MGQERGLKKNVNIKVDPALWQQAKIEAMKQGKKLLTYIAEAIREKIDRGR